MLAVTYTAMRNRMKKYMDMISDDFETVTVTRKNNKNIVMMSGEAYDNLIENVHVMGNKANYDWLMESKAQYEAGRAAARELIGAASNE